MLPALRVVAVLHALSFLLQPIMAGFFLSGQDSAIDMHATNATIVVVLCLVMTVLAVLAWRRRLIPRAAFTISLALLVVEIVQTGAGYGHVMWIHIPLGVADDGRRRAAHAAGDAALHAGGRRMSGLRMSRRGALRLFGGAGMAAVLAPTLASCAKPGSDGINPGTLASKAKLPKPFTVPLPILQALAPDSTDAQGVHYSMTLQQAEAEILPGYKTKIFGYNGTFPGPYLDVHAGTPMIVHQTNQLPVPIVTHLHGGLTPPSDDGFPTDLVFPKALADMANPGTAAPMAGMDGMPAMADPLAHLTAVQRDYVFPLDQRAATLWYHDHRMDFSGVQVWRGLFGLCVVRDAEDDKLPLPKGEREIPLMIADRAFDADGQLIYPEKDPTLLGKPSMDTSIAAGAQGDVILVNGAPWPFLEVAAVKYRLRLVNASNARRYELKLDGPGGGGQFVQVGSDGGLLAAPVTHSTLHMSPAERFDVVVDFSKYPVGSTVTLKNAADSGGAGQVMQFKVTAEGPRRLLGPGHAVHDREADRGRGQAAPGLRAWTATSGT